ncbi:MAG TPA: hypothetical protein VGF01_11710 [Terracidiphilus sp.]|jgi:hypothetical protein
MPQENAKTAERKKTPGSGPIKSRAELRAMFANGSLPDQNAFSQLIDSLVHKDDAEVSPVTDASGGKNGANHRITAQNRSWYVYIDAKNNLVVSESDAVRLRLNANSHIDLGATDSPFALDVDGWVGIPMRIGTYKPDDDMRHVFPSTALTRMQLPADGRWHRVLTGINSCQAFEIVASAAGSKASKAAAITHAIAVNASGHGKSIRQTFSYEGWDWRRRIRFQWQADGGGWFKKATGYTLRVRTGCNYGKGDDGNPAMIQYHITKLW